MDSNYRSTTIKGMVVLIYILLIILEIGLSLYVFLAIRSPGRPGDFRDKDQNLLRGSISEKAFVSIGGVTQGMILRGKNLDNPVLLFLHGGPGFPTYFLVEKFNSGLEDHFTVCYWEQRGGGLSFTPEVTSESMTLKQLTSDALEVTNYLRRRFNKEKIYIMAHSGGTAIGLSAVARSPRLYSAYIAVAQLTRQSESEKIAYDFMLKKLAEKKNRRLVKKLKKYRDLETNADLLAFYNSAIRDEAMHALGIGTMQEMRSVFTGIFIPSWTCKAYTLSEKYKTWKSKFFFLPKTNLRRETLWTDLSAAYPAIEIPVFFICGKYDLTVNSGLTRKYYNRLKAPAKRIYTFEHSAHSPFLEEPGRFNEILEKDILPQFLPAIQKADVEIFKDAFPPVDMG